MLYVITRYMYRVGCPLEKEPPGFDHKKNVYRVWLKELEQTFHATYARNKMCTALSVVQPIHDGPKLAACGRMPMQ